MNSDPPSQMHESLVENFFVFNQGRGNLEDEFKRPKPFLFSPIFTRKKRSERSSEEDCKRLVNVLQSAHNAVFRQTLPSVLHSCSVYKISFSRLNC